MLLIPTIHIMTEMQVMLSAAVFGTETEDGQVTVITRRGAVSSVHKLGQERMVSHI